MEQNYGPNADGIPGHDEAGALSAWYVFSAMGFYPVSPASGIYQIGSPLFQRIEIVIDKSFYPGDNLVVKTLNNSPKNAYIQSMDLNGIPEKSYHLTHDTLTRGGVLSLKMGPEALQ
jgi:putative alpha-1,2-mannosidase